MVDKPGPTNDFPEGKLNADDEGGIVIGVTSVEGKVIVDFGKSVAWLGLNPQDAMNIASTIVMHARKAAKHNGETVSFSL